MEKFVQILDALQSPQTDVRKQAEAEYENARKNTPDMVLNALKTVIANPAHEQRHEFACILLRRVVLKTGDHSFWKELQNDSKSQFCTFLLQLYEKSDESPHGIKVMQKVGSLIEPVTEWLSDDTPFWPDLMPMMMRVVGCPSAKKREEAVKLLAELVMNVTPVKDMLVKNPEGCKQLIQTGFSDSTMEVRARTAVLVLCMVAHWDQKEWSPLQCTLKVILDTFRALLTANLSDTLNDLLQALVECAEKEPRFFKNELPSLVETCAEVMQAVNMVEEGMRASAMELLTTIAEMKPKMVQKTVPNFAEVVLRASLEFMCEIEEDPDWSGRMDDEEADDDKETVTIGAEKVDRLVESWGIEATQKPFLQLINEYVQRDSWQARFASCQAIRYATEYFEDKTLVDQLADILLHHTGHPHARVRAVAWLALGQMAGDQAPSFEERKHTQLVPAVVRAMKDPEMRVQQTALTCFVTFGEELDHTHMEEYAHGLMELLVKTIQNTTHRGVREECITSIAVIAGVVEKEFEKYYDHIVPMLKTFITTATEKEENRLRGKAFECLSLLGQAVGKERFKKDAGEAMEAMCKTKVDSSDIQADYIREAMSRICVCLKKDFAPYLEYILPNLFKVLEMKDAKVGDEAEIGMDKDDEIVECDDGQKIRTSALKEVAEASESLITFVHELQEAYFPMVQKTALVLLPYVKNADKGVYHCADEAREYVNSCWAELITVCMKVGTEEGKKLAVDLLVQFCQHMFRIMKEWRNEETDTVDLDDVKVAATGLAKCLQAGKGELLQADSVCQMLALPLELLERTFVVREETLRSLKERGIEEDEDDMDQEGIEHEAQVQISELLGALMLTSPATFEQHALAKVGQVLQATLNNKNPALQREDLKLGLLIVCDILEHLKERSVSGWAVFMPKVLDALHNTDADIRTPAGYSVNLAARIPQFREVVAVAHSRIDDVLQGRTKFGKKRDDKSRVALDNMVAALVQLLVHHAGALEPAAVTRGWAQVVERLPLRDDTTEGEKLHQQLLQLVVAQDPRVVGPGGVSAARWLGVFAEVYNSESSTDELNKEIRCLFAKKVSQEQLQQWEKEFTTKQVKKIQRILKDMD